MPNEVPKGKWGKYELLLFLNICNIKVRHQNELVKIMVTITGDDASSYQVIHPRNAGQPQTLSTKENVIVFVSYWNKNVG